ncbi:acyl-CoA thioesterase [Curvivirga sp.]|uniref:acyl-CoA thioesterase n=1 Tax=Curvivirga sp. TaxID=2856848 RepID=UPI003B5BEE51
MLSASTIIKIEFYHLDPMNIVWHGNYPRFFEQARCVMLDKIGYNYPEMKESGYAWPIVDMRIKYIKPLRFGQEIEVTASLIEFENRMKINYLITDRVTGEKITKGTTIQVAVSTDTEEMQFVSPDIFINKVKDL